MKIVLNIGHSEIDSGATSLDGKIEEYTFNKKYLVPLIKQELELNRHEVIVITQIKSFSELPKRINAVKPDIIISVHSNCANGIASGTETLYWTFSKKGKKLAESIQRNMVACLKLHDRGSKPLLSSDRGAALLRDTNAPAVILEPFFIDNKNDYTVAFMKIQELAKAIAKGVEDWI